MLASHDAAEGDAVDGGEHQAHEGADEDQRGDTDPARASAQDDREAQQRGHHTAEGEETRGGEPAHQPGVDEAGEAVADDGDQVDAAGGGLQTARLLHHQADGEAPESLLLSSNILLPMQPMTMVVSNAVYLLYIGIV